MYCARRASTRVEVTDQGQYPYCIVIGVPNRAPKTLNHPKEKNQKKKAATRLNHVTLTEISVQGCPPLDTPNQFRVNFGLPRNERWAEWMCDAGRMLNGEQTADVVAHCDRVVARWPTFIPFNQRKLHRCGPPVTYPPARGPMESYLLQRAGQFLEPPTGSAPLKQTQLEQALSTTRSGVGGKCAARSPIDWFHRFLLATDGDGYTPLHIAASHNNVPLMEVLVSSEAGYAGPWGWGGKPETMMNRHPCPCGSGRTWKQCCSGNNLGMVATFVAEGGSTARSLEPKPTHGTTPLHVAASHGHKAAAKFLLDEGASLSVEDVAMLIPADLATKNAHVDLAAWLEAQGAHLGTQGDRITAADLPTHETVPPKPVLVAGVSSMEGVILERHGGDQLGVAWEAGVEVLAEVLRVPPSWAQILLEQNDWDPHKAAAAFKANSDAECNRAGLPPINRSLLDPAVNVAAAAAAAPECPVCYSDAPADGLRGLGCGHAFCDECWQRHIDVTVLQRASLKISCCLQGCPFRVPKDLIDQLASPRAAAVYVTH